MENHRYNTRSRNRSASRNASPAPNRAESDRSCSSRRRPRNRSHPICEPQRTATCLEKWIKIARIVLLVTLVALFIWYGSDKTYTNLRKELDSLSCHINTMENIFKSASDKKGSMEKQLVEIAKSLPQIKEMAESLRQGVNNCKFPRKALTYVNLLKDRILIKGTCGIRSLIQEELEKYAADKTGQTDYALESSGGMILHTRNTKSFQARAPSLSLFGIPLCQSSNSPRALIQPGVMPGECWAFKGSFGSAVIQLLRPITITGVSLEHISKKISPSGNIYTAPKDFSILGLKKPYDTDGYFFGKFTYIIDGPSVQYFPIMSKCASKYEIIEFKVHSNHGHSDFTCVYRLRVHGESN